MLKNSAGETIYYGRSIKSPSTSENKINITQRVRDYLDSNLGIGWESGSTAEVRKQLGAYQVFALTNGEILLESYAFIFDWEESFTGDDEILSEPVNEKLDPRMKMLWTRFGKTSKNIGMEFGYPDIKFRYMGEKNFDFSGQTRGYYYQSLDSSIINFGSDDSWVTVTKQSNLIFTLTVETNTGATREGHFYITYYDENFNVKKEVYSFTQYEEQLYVVFSGNTNFDYSSGSTTVAFSANTMLDALSITSWYSIGNINQETLQSPLGVYNTVGTIEINYQANDGVSGRIAEAKFRRKDYGYGHIETLELSQGYHYFELISQSAYTVEYVQTGFTANVNTNAKSVVVQSDSQWVTVNYNNGVITFNVQQNGLALYRNAVVNVYTDFSPSVAVCTISIKQLGSEEAQNRLTTEALTDGVITLDKIMYSSSAAGPYSYRVNKGQWVSQKVGNGQRISVNVNAGDKVEWSFTAGEGTTGKTADGVSFGYGFSGGSLIYNTTTCDFKVYGNILSMAWGEDYLSPPNNMLPMNKHHKFQNLFYRCTTLKDASGLVLPSSGLTEGIYSSMFMYCSGMTTPPPIVAADEFRENACNQMFNMCTSLTSVPQLPCMKLGNSAYASMFENCCSLTEAPELPATTIGQECYSFMFVGCSGMTKGPSVLPALNVPYRAYYSMFGYQYEPHCCSITKTPEIKAQVLGNRAMQSMFESCTALTGSCDFDFTSVGQEACWKMFRGCTGLVKAPSELSVVGEYSYDSMFNGCSSLTTAPDLTFIGNASNCQGMFKNCTSLSYIKCLSQSGVSPSWVQNVSPTGTFVKAAGVSWQSGDNGIPTGWTVEEVAV